MLDSTDIEEIKTVTGELIITKKENPLADGVECRLIASGKNLIDTIDESNLRFSPGFDYVVYVNDTLVTRDEYETFFPAPQDIITIYAVMKGHRHGGGTGKTILRVIAVVAVVAAAIFLGPVAAGALGMTTATGSLTTAGLFVSALVTAGVSAIGMMLVDKLIPLPMPDMDAVTNEDTETSQRYAIENATNKTNPWGTIPILIGTHRFYPPLITPMQQELINQKNYAKILLCLGYGVNRINQISGLDAIMLGDTSVFNFNTSDEVLYTYYPNYTGGPIRFFDTGLVQIASNSNLKKPADGYINFSTPANSQRAILTIGTKNVYAMDQSVSIVAEWKKRSDTTWMNALSGSSIDGSTIDFTNAGFTTDLFIIMANGSYNYFPYAYPGRGACDSHAYTIQALPINRTDPIYPGNGFFPANVDIGSADFIQTIGVVLASGNDYVIKSNDYSSSPWQTIAVPSKGIFPRNGYHDSQIGLYILRTTPTVINGAVYNIPSRIVDLRPLTWNDGISNKYFALGKIESASACGYVVNSPGVLHFYGTNLPQDSTYKYNTANLFEVNLKILLYGDPNGEYDVRISLNPDVKEPDIPVYAKYLSCYKQDTSYCKESGLSLLAMRILASSSFNSSLDEVNVVASHCGLTYNEVTDVFEYGYSSNCADGFLEVLTCQANKRRVTLNDIDLDRIKEWHRFCTINGFNYDVFMDAPLSVNDLLRQICNAGRASFTQRGGKYSVIIDKYNNVPVQMFTPRNTWNFSAKKSYYDDIHGLRLTFMDANHGWKSGETIVYLDGYNESNALYIEELKIEGVTSLEQVNKIGKYHLSQLRLRNETFSFSADIEHIICTRGDRIILQYDVSLAGISSGRITAINITNNFISSIVVDEECCMDQSKLYNIKVRTHDGVIRAISLANSTNATTLTPATNEPLGELRIGDLFLFGEAGKEAIDLLVTNISPSSDYSAEITCCPYIPELYLNSYESHQLTNSNFTIGSPNILIPSNYLTVGTKLRFNEGAKGNAFIDTYFDFFGCVLPYPFVFGVDYYVISSSGNYIQLANTANGTAISPTNLGAGSFSLTTNFAITTNIQVDLVFPKPIFKSFISNAPAIIYDATGNPTYCIIANFDPYNAATLAGIKKINLTWIKTEDIGTKQPNRFSCGNETTEYRVVNVEVGVSYTFTLSFVYSNGKSSETITTTHVVIGDDLPPIPATFDVANSGFNSATLSLKMTHPDDVRFSYYELKTIDADWGKPDTHLLYRGVSPIHQFKPTTLGVTYFLKVYTTTGKYSTAAATITPEQVPLRITYFRNSFYLSNCQFYWDSPNGDILNQFKLALYTDSDMTDLMHEFLELSGNTYNLTKEDNTLFTRGIPVRDVYAKLTLLDIYGRTLISTNHACNDLPPDLTTFNMVAGKNTITVTYDMTPYRVSGYTPIGDPDKITITNDSEGRELGVKWISETTNSVDYFEVFCGTTNNPTTLMGVSYSGSFIIQNLLPSTLYYIRLRPVDTFGPANFSPSLSITTTA